MLIYEDREYANTVAYLFISLFPYKAYEHNMGHDDNKI